MRKFCEWLSKNLKQITIMVPNPLTGVKEKYLTRHYLLGKDVTGNKFSIFLHKFHSSDQDLELHNHPWKWSFGIILAGGYVEEFRDKNDNVVTKTVRPWSINFITNEKFHRVTLLEKDCWSLFFAGPRTQSWGFWDKSTKIFRDWKSNPNAIE